MSAEVSGSGFCSVFPLQDVSFLRLFPQVPRGRPRLLVLLELLLPGGNPCGGAETSDMDVKGRGGGGGGPRPDAPREPCGVQTGLWEAGGGARGPVRGRRGREVPGSGAGGESVLGRTENSCLGFWGVRACACVRVPCHPRLGNVEGEPL